MEAGSLVQSVTVTRPIQKINIVMTAYLHITIKGIVNGITNHKSLAREYFQILPHEIREISAQRYACNSVFGNGLFRFPERGWDTDLYG